MYFSFFPKINSFPVNIIKGDYTDEYSGNISFDDLYRNISIINFRSHHDYYFQKEQILNGERPDQLSTRLYGSPNYFWTFFIVNEHLRLGEALQWPLDENHLRRKIANDYEGKALISFKSRYILGFRPRIASLKDNSAIFKKFKIGETIIGQQSGAQGELRVVSVNTGQLVVLPSTEQVQFKSNEIISGQTSGCSLFVHDIIEYQDAPMYYIDENDRECSHPNFIFMGDPNLNETLYTPVSYKEHWFKVNEELSTIRVLNKSSLLKFEDTFRTLIRKRPYIIT